MSLLYGWNSGLEAPVGEKAVVRVDVGLEDVAGDAGSCGEERDGGHPRQKTESQQPLLLTPVPLVSPVRTGTAGNAAGLLPLGVPDEALLMT